MKISKETKQSIQASIQEAINQSKKIVYERTTQTGKAQIQLSFPQTEKEG